MKHFNQLFLLVFITLLSCSGNSDDEDFNFTISQNIENIQELDEVYFNLDNINGSNITNATWYLNSSQVENNSLFYIKKFNEFGTFDLKVIVNYNNGQSKTIQKNLIVTERPKYNVTIKKVEILSYAFDNDFYVSLIGYRVKLKFDIRELDVFGNETIKYISTENTDNWANSSVMYYPKVWDVSSANYKVKVFQSGNYFPNNHPNYHTKIIFYSAKSQQAVQQPYLEFNTYRLDLNPYRTLQPTTITENNNGLQVRLTLQWN